MTTAPVMALCLPPANFSNRFAVKHTIHNYILHITMLAIDITRALNLSMNQSYVQHSIGWSASQKPKTQCCMLVKFGTNEALSQPFTVKMPTVRFTYGRVRAFVKI